MGARNWVRGQIQAFLRVSPDDEEPEWERKGRISRFADWTRGRRWYVATGFFLIIGFLGALSPYIPEIQVLQPVWPFATGIALVLIGYLWGHKSALGLIRELEQFVIYTGDRLAVHIGRSRTMDDGSRAFETLHSLGTGGFNPKYKTLRDRYARRDIERHKEKYHRFTEDGDDTLRLRIPPHSVEQLSDDDISLLKRVIVAHVGQVEDDLSSPDTDVQFTLPDTLNTSASTTVSRLFEGQKTQLNLIDDRLRIMRQHVESLANDERNITERDRDKFIGELDVISKLLHGQQVSDDDSKVSVDLSGVERDAQDRTNDRLGNDE